MLKTLAIIFGIFFILFGILGFIPSVAPMNMLFGVFSANALLNIVYLISGIIALWTGFTSTHASKLYFQIFGIIYALITILGFIAGECYILGIFANNMANNWLHLVIAVIALWVGFMKTPRRSR